MKQNKVLLAIKDQKSIKVVGWSEKFETIKKPEPINTNDLIRIASNKYGFPSDKTKKVAERLYSKGYISYPRTQGRKYTSEDEVKYILNDYSKNDYYKDDASYILSKDNYIYETNFGDADHPPITPVANNKRIYMLKGKDKDEFDEYKDEFDFYKEDSDLNSKDSDKDSEDSDELKIFELVLKCFYASLSKDVGYKSVTTTFKVGNIMFKETHFIMTHEGFSKYIDPNLISSKQIKFVDYTFKTNQSLKINSLKVLKWQTAPEKIS